MQQAETYRLFYNLERQNSYKGMKTPWLMAQQDWEEDDRATHIAALRAVDLDKMTVSEYNFGGPRQADYSAFSEKAFVWKGHDPNFNGHKSWNEQKIGDFIHHWHSRAIGSTKMEKPSAYLTDEEGKPTFMEIEDASDRAKMIECYRENFVYYKKFVQASQDHLF